MKVDIRSSKDGTMFSTWRIRDPVENAVTVRRLGQSREWIFDVRITDDAVVDILNASIKIQELET